MKKFITKIIIYILNKKGYHSYSAYRLLNELFEDLFRNRQNTLKQKFWAYKKGFLSSKIQEYGLTDDNFNLYISDFDYYKLYPINGKYKKMIDDKLLLKYVLSPFDDYLPKYYCHIKKGKEILPLMDGNSIKSIEDIAELLKEEKQLALKLTDGSFGKGFYKLSYLNNNIFINNDSINEKELIEFLTKLEDYLVTEYITVHSDISMVNNYSANALRVMVINDNGIQPLVANAFMRFGTKASGVIDHAEAGGIFSIVDIDSGRYHDGKRMVNYNIENCRFHPDTKFKIEGYIPNWALIKTKIIEISRYLNEVTYMGFDIAITNNGFKILEINSHQDITNFQYYYPLLINNSVEAFFKELLKNKRGN